MATSLQYAYYFVAAFCAVASIVLLWRRDKRETEVGNLDRRESLQDFRDSTRSRTIDLLYHSLAPIRKMYLHLSDEDRIRAELELIFAKPDIVHTLKAIQFELFEFESHQRRLRYMRYARSVSLLVSVVSLTAVLYPFIMALLGDATEYRAVSWMMLVLLPESVAIFLASTIYKIRLERSATSILHDRSGHV